MNKSKIEWCDMTWNPITGCLHGCRYCYARKLTARFGCDTTLHVENLDTDPLYKHIKQLESKKGFELLRPCANLYPFGFAPTLHKYRLNEPQKVKKPQTVFVGSMADMFGEWVPDEWVREVFRSCLQAPRHRYLFLTKNPSRYYDVMELLFHLDREYEAGRDFWVGATATNQYQADALNAPDKIVRWVSLEPLQESVDITQLLSKRPSWGRERLIKWIVVGAESGNRKNKIIPKRERIEDIVNACRNASVPVFLKNNLAKIWGEPLIQEFPWDTQNSKADLRK